MYSLKGHSRSARDGKRDWNVVSQGPADSHNARQGRHLVQAVVRFALLELPRVHTKLGSDAHLLHVAEKLLLHGLEGGSVRQNCSAPEVDPGSMAIAEGDPGPACEVHPNSGEMVVEVRSQGVIGIEPPCIQRHRHGTGPQ
ncbi:hypothetical protein JX265_000089 [Neoarthrinium moseri]|uniref:Uncharacterized protein n=1 Tax=Neoarthrinium moseri TaxID=1658444 RepID=A0A9Q0ARX9_9PEZI|nr:hypothetical protein JX265_000089 [Neoarthrinium moseri]